jgi:hypothetical protein
MDIKKKGDKEKNNLVNTNQREKRRRKSIDN